MDDKIEIVSISLGELSKLPYFYFKRNKFSFLENVNYMRDKTNGYKYKIDKPYNLVYMFNDLEKTVTVPKNFLCDGNSGWIDRGVDWIFHDWLYATHGEKDGLGHLPEKERKIIADRLLCEVQKFSGRNCIVQRLHRWFFNCPIFTIDERAWESSGKRDAEFFVD